MQAIQRTCAILRIIAQYNGEIGVSRIAQKLDLPKSTISRFLAALEAENLVTRSAQNLFSLGPQLLELTSQPTFAHSLAAIARSELLALNQQTGEAVGLSVLDGHNTTYLDHLASIHAVQVMDWTGRSVPLHITSSGKLLLAHSSPEFINSYLKQPLEAFSSYSITSAERLKKQFLAIRTQGFAISNEEFASGVLGYAVPIRNETGTIIAAITLYGPKYRLTKRDELVKALKSSSRAIEAQWRKG